MNSTSTSWRKYPTRRRAVPARLVEGRDPLHQRYRHAPLAAPPRTTTATAMDLARTDEVPDEDELQLDMIGEDLPFVEDEDLNPVQEQDYERDMQDPSVMWVC